MGDCIEELVLKAPWGTVRGSGKATKSLILARKKYACLFGDKKGTIDAWRRISKEIGIPMSKCAIKWRNLTSTYKALLRERDPHESWKYFDLMATILNKNKKTRAIEEVLEEYVKVEDIKSTERESFAMVERMNGHEYVKDPIFIDSEREEDKEPEMCRVPEPPPPPPPPPPAPAASTSSSERITRKRKSESKKQKSQLPFDSILYDTIKRVRRDLKEQSKMRQTIMELARVMLEKHGRSASSS